MKDFIKIFTFILILQPILSCSIFENEEYPDQSHIDYLVGIEESGRLKKELHFSDSEDETVNSLIEFVYKNDRLIIKIYTDNNWNSPYVLQRDDFYYEEDRLTQMIHYFRKSTPTSPLVISDIHYYFYPNENEIVISKYNEEGERRDSVICIYENDLLISEKHFSSSLGEWEIVNTYNSDGKLRESIELPGQHLTKNYFDKDGLLYKSESLVEGEVKATSYYEREVTSNQMVIKVYSENPYNNYERDLTSYKKYENGKLIESVKYHPTFFGSEWWCHRYEYF